MSLLRLARPGKVDVVYGGQFGDEGKGTVAAALGHLYDFAVRVGGQNAEHRFDWRGVQYTGRIWPSSIVRNTEGYRQHQVLGAGHIIDPYEAVKELLHYANGDVAKAQRLTGHIIIDRNTGVVTDAHREESRNRKKAGGSTWQGIGVAAAHKVRRDGTFPTVGQLITPDGFLEVFLSGDECSENPVVFRFRVDNTSDIMSIWSDHGWIGLAEGSQGALLSLDHGYYPYCTAKNVTPAGIFAEAGLPLSRAGMSIGVYRMLPMRVPGNSGPTGGREIPWQELESFLGEELPMERKIQTDSPIGEVERIFEWSWADFAWSFALTRPDCIVLTFADYHHPQNKFATEWDQLHPTTKQLVMDVSRYAPVIMVRTGPGQFDYVAGLGIPEGWSQGPLQRTIHGLMLKK